MRSNAPTQLDAYPFQFDIPTRFSDLDLQGHVNNVQVANLYQESRVMFHREAFRELRKKSEEHRSLRTVLADIHIAYMRETHYPKPITIGIGVSRVGNSSYTLTAAMFQNGECMGVSDAVLVYVSDGKPIAMPTVTREELNKHLISI